VSGGCFSLLQPSPTFPVTLGAKEETSVTVRYVPGPSVCRGSLEIHTEAGKKGASLRVVPLEGTAVPAVDMNAAPKLPQLMTNTNLQGRSRKSVCAAIGRRELECGG
jgi:hypothetical protein